MLRSKAIRLVLMTLLLTLLTLLSASSRAEADFQPQPAVTVSLAGLQRLLDDVRMLSRVSDRPGIAELVEGQLERFGELQGIDRDRPLGLFLFPDCGKPKQPGVVIAVPVADVELLRQLLQRYGIRLFETDEDEWIIEVPGRRQRGRMIDRTLIISQVDQLLERFDETLLASLARLSEEYAAAVEIQRSGIPPADLDRGLREFEERLEAEMERREGEAVHEHELRHKVLTLARRWGRSVIPQTRSLRTGIRFDRGIELHADWISEPESELARSLAALRLDSAKLARQGGGAEGGTALELHLAMRLPDVLRTLLLDLAETVQRRVDEDVARKLRPGEVNPLAGLFAALQNTLRRGRFEATARFLPAADGKMVFLSKFSVEDSTALERSLERVLPYSRKAREIAEVELNAVQNGGLNLHRLTPGEVRKRDQRLYGPEPAVYIGTAEDQFWFAVGGETLGEMLSLLRTEETPSPPLVALTWSFAPWIRLAERDQPREELKLLQEAFSTPGEDTLRAVVTSERTGARLVVTCGPGYTRLLGILLTHRKR